VDYGRDYKFIGRMFPFHDRPDIAVRVLWFPVSLDTPTVPFPNPFVLRNWDRLEQEPQTELGTDQTYHEKYDGPLPINLPGTVCGTADQWANGISYADWLASPPACDCPEMIFMPTVNSVFNADGSLIVAPHVGDVEVHLAVDHPNTWTAKQVFTPALPGESAVEIKAKAGQNVPYALTRRSDGTVAMQSRPSSAEVDFLLEILAHGGQVTVQLDDSGNLKLRDATGAQGLDIAHDPGGGGKPASEVFLPHNAVTHIASNTWIGALATPDPPFAISCTLQVFNGFNHSEAALIVGGSPGLPAHGSFTVYTGSVTGWEGDVVVNQNLGAHAATLHVGGNDLAIGVNIRGAATGVPGFPALVVEDHTLGQVCGFLFSGHLWTATAEAPTTTGTIVKRWPVYNAAGSLVGYLPLYDDL